MTQSTKIDFRHRRISQLADITDLVGVMFPGNSNQQHAAARILLLLKQSTSPVASLADLETQFRISRRTLQRTRAKLSRMGLIHRVSWLNARFGGREGWQLSSRMSGALRRLADWLDEWKRDTRTERQLKDAQLIGLLR
jgi:DNA-binding HxlR family transcriptional regulator